MKIKNIGQSNFMLTDKRGNSIVLEPSFTADVEDGKARKLLRVYPFLKEVEKAEPKIEVKKETKDEEKLEKPVEVVRETKKKRKK